MTQTERRVCILGDGNFSFTQCLIKNKKFSYKFLGFKDSIISSITTCSLDSYKEIIQKYPEFKDYKWPDYVQVQHEINALELENSFKGYDVYVWNHPHIGIEDFRKHSKLLLDFFSCLKSLNAQKVIITLVLGQFERWDVLNSANSQNYFLEFAEILKDEEFNGWKAVRNTSGKCFKNNPTISRSKSKISIKFVFSQSQKENIKYNQALEFDQESSHQCVECTKSFNSLRGLKQHIHMVHVLKKFKDWSFNGDARFECQECDKKFRAQVDLDTHVKAMHVQVEAAVGDTRVCPKCFRAFVRQRDLLQHFKYLHC